jgi:hypothetical protein
MLRRITTFFFLFLFTGLLMLKDKLIIGKPYNAQVVMERKFAALD